MRANATWAWFLKRALLGLGPCRCWGQTATHPPLQKALKSYCGNRSHRPVFVVYWRMLIHRRLNRKHFYFFTLLSIMLGETPLSCPLTFLGWLPESFRGLCFMVPEQALPPLPSVELPGS